MITASDTAGTNVKSVDPIPLTRFNDREANINIDGHMDESAWAGLPTYNEMRVLRPDTLAAVPYKTAVRFFYTEKGLYVSFDMEQPKETIIERFTVRDVLGVNRDYTSITLDTSGDGRYGYWMNVALVRAGRALKPLEWPDGKRCAVALSFDCDHETYELGSGGTAIGRLAWGEFGRRVGVPRVLEVLGRHEVTASFFMPAVCALIDPEETKRIVDAGHEVGLHGWIHENNSKLDAGTERDLILRARDVLEKQMGEAPLGFRPANWDLSPHTIEIITDLGLEYDSSLMADESCYELLLDGEATGVVEVPVEWLRDDAVYLMFNREPARRPWMSPDDVFNIFRRELDAAWEERGLFQLVMHPFIIGYRSRIWILDNLIEYAKSKGNVWFGSHAEVAKWAKENSLV